MLLKNRHQWNKLPTSSMTPMTCPWPQPHPACPVMLWTVGHRSSLSAPFLNAANKTFALCPAWGEKVRKLLKVGLTYSKPTNKVWLKDVGWHNSQQKGGYFKHVFSMARLTQKGNRNVWDIWHLVQDLSAELSSTTGSTTSFQSVILPFHEVYLPETSWM